MNLHVALHDLGVQLASFTLGSILLRDKVCDLTFVLLRLLNQDSVLFLESFDVFNHQGQLFLTRLDFSLNLVMLGIFVANLHLKTLQLFVETLVGLLEFCALSTVLHNFSLHALLTLGQGLQVHKHVLIIGTQLLDLLVFHAHRVLERNNFLALLLDNERHLLCLRLQVHQSLLGLTQFAVHHCLHCLVLFKKLR